MRNNVSLNLDNQSLTEENIKAAILPYMQKVGTSFLNMRFSGGQHVTALVSASGGFALAIVFSYYYAGVLNLYRYHSTNGWTKYTLTGTQV